MDFTSKTKIAEAEQMIAGMDAEISAVTNLQANADLSGTDEEKKAIAEELSRLNKQRAKFVGSLSDAILEKTDLGGGFTLYDLQESLLKNPYIQDLVNPARITSIE
jgi:hypothetical protein